MDCSYLSSPEQRPRKRRAIRACVNCRTSKVRCDGRRPCQRCERNDAVCVFHGAVKDPNMLRIEKLEQEVAVLRTCSTQTAHRSSKSCAVLHTPSPNGDNSEQSRTTIPTEQLAQSHPILAPENSVQTTPWQRMRHDLVSSAVGAGLITHEQAMRWYDCFFSGSQFLVPIFCEKYDSFNSVLTQSPFLFDTLISIGCRAEEGIGSAACRQLQSRARDHLTNFMLNGEKPTLRDVQAITLMAAYSENSFILIALALRFALQLELHHAADRLIANRHAETVKTDEQELYRLSRTWHCICNLELLYVSRICSKQLYSQTPASL